MKTEVVFLVAWVVMALFAAHVASRKRRSTALYLLLGLATGPLALLAALLVPAKKGKAVIAPTKLCPDCATEVPSIARVCRACGFEFARDREELVLSLAAKADTSSMSRKEREAFVEQLRQSVGTYQARRAQ